MIEENEIAEQLIEEIEKSFTYRKGQISSSRYSIQNPIITNILLWRLNKKLDCLITKNKAEQK